METDGMKYSYGIIAHIKYSIFKLLLDVLLSFAISAAFFILMQHIVGIPILFCVLILPVNYLSNDIRTFWRQHKYESGSELCITPEKEVPLEITIQKDVYRILYHIHSVTGVKRSWKGIAIQGSITAEYIYDPQIGRYDTEDTDRIVISPYFTDIKGIVRTLSNMIIHST